MRVVSVQGFTKTGKTTVCEALIAGLAERGYSVGSVKEIHFEEFAIDTPGSNTDRHRQAGSTQTTALGLHETDILFPTKLPIRTLLEHYDHDFVICEGSNDPCVPTIVTAKDTTEIPQKDNGALFAVSGRIAAAIDSYEGLPAIDVTRDPEELVDLVERYSLPLLPNYSKERCGLCGMDCVEFCRAFLRGEKRRDDCVLCADGIRVFDGDEEIILTSEQKEMFALLAARLMESPGRVQSPEGL